jgi:hypothetical protein
MGECDLRDLVTPPASDFDQNVSVTIGLLDERFAKDAVCEARRLSDDHFALSKFKG